MFGRNKKEVEITVSNLTMVRILAFIIGAGLLLNFFSNIIHPLTLIFVSFFLALVLNPVVTAISSRLKSKSRTRATAISYIAVMTFLIGFFSLVLPPLITQTADFIENIPQTLRDLEDEPGAVGDFVRSNSLQEQIVVLANDWANDTSVVADQAVTTANRVISNLISIITVLILTFMMLVEGPKWIALFWKQYPKDKRNHAKKLAKKIYGVVTSYVNGQVLVAAIGAFFAVVALFIATTIFNVTAINPIAFGGIVFLFSLIPTIGVIISTIIVVLFSLFVSVPLAITMLVFFIVYQQIENASIQPYVQSRANELTPLIVFLAAILGIGFGGILGAIVAIPIAGSIKVIIDDYMEEKRGLSPDDTISSDS
jgi:predicted PurR-regulated permease PerM